MILPISYANGTTVVTTTRQGVTTIEDPTGKFTVDFPDTIDLKVTNKCGAGCWFCHESSTLKGKHADLASLLKILEGFPKGIQIAIGGGNPLDWPHLADFFKAVGNKFILNLTINAAHLTSSTANFLKNLQDENLLHGIGISSVGPYFSYESINYKPSYQLKHIVMHTIVGTIDEWLLKEYLDDLFENVVPNILFLGYKDYGRGALSKHHDRSSYIIDNIEQMKDSLPKILARAKKHKCTLSFDNLALEQLKVKRYIDPGIWNKHYLGDEGQRSMYIDAVEQTSAESSFSTKRVYWKDEEPLEYFKNKLNASTTLV